MERTGRGSRAHRRWAWSVACLVLAGCTAGVCFGASMTATDISDLGGRVAIRTWLVAGPLPNVDLPYQGPNRGPRREGFDKNYLADYGGEADFKPEEGTEIAGPNGQVYRFLKRTWNTPNIDLTEHFGRADYAVAYLYAELVSDDDQRVYFHMGSDDASKLWVGGTLIAAHTGDGGARRSQYIVPVTISAGRTSVLWKVDQAHGGWGGYVEVADTPGQPDQYTLTRRRDFMVGDKWLSGLGLPEDAIAIVAIITIFGVPILVLVLIAWFWMRHTTERERHRKETILALTKHGTDPDLIQPALQTAESSGSRRAGMLVWGLVLALGGFGLTVAEVARAGFGNAGFELFVMLAGVALLISWKAFSGDAPDRQ